MPGSVPDIPGQKAPAQHLQGLRYRVSRLLDRKQTSFPGAQPVSFAARHLLELQKEDYYVCEKSDGVRCLMYLTSEDGRELVYLIDRRNDYFLVQNLHFPISGRDKEAFHPDTIVDGELVNDIQPNGSVEMRYLVFDCLVLDGNSLMHRTLDKRLAYFRDKVYNPYTALYEEFPTEIPFLPFIVKFKEMQLGYAIELMFDKVLPSLPHGNDGLIFTCRNSAYQFGTDHHIVKWKPENENSIDFRMSLVFPMLDSDTEDSAGDAGPYPDYDAMPQIDLFVFGGADKDIHYGTMMLERHEWEDMKSLNEPLDDRVVECYLDGSGRWRYLRFRDDKKEANHISTVESVMESIRDKVSKDDLIKASKGIRDEWKRRAASEESKPRKILMTKEVHGLGRDAQSGNNATKRKFEYNEETTNIEKKT